MPKTKSKLFENTKEALLGMLREDTGRSLLDSGDYYGRNHERNQTRDITSEPPITVEFHADTKEAIPCISTYHYLKRVLEYDREEDERLQRFIREQDENFLSCMESYVSRYHPDRGGLYGEGDPWTVNSYNGECNLDQTIQLTYADGLILLQIHGGCDVRGGYTRPRAFRTESHDDARLFMWADATLEDPDADTYGYYWTTDDGGYHWYGQGSTGERELGGYKWKHIDNIEAEGQQEAREYAHDYNAVVVIGGGEAYSPLSGAMLRPRM